MGKKTQIVSGLIGSTEGLIGIATGIENLNVFTFPLKAGYYELIPLAEIESPNPKTIPIHRGNIIVCLAIFPFSNFLICIVCVASMFVCYCCMF